MSCASKQHDSSNQKTRHWQKERLKEDENHGETGKLKHGKQDLGTAKFDFIWVNCFHRKNGEKRQW